MDIAAPGLVAVVPARSVVGTAACTTEARARDAWREADYFRMLVADEVQAQLGRGIKGSAVVRRVRKEFPIVSDATTKVETKSEFWLLEAILAAGLPRPATNAQLRLPGRTYRPDMVYWRLRLVVEVDGGVHDRADRARNDQLRDAHMRAHGWTVLRIRKADVERDAGACARRVAEAVAEQRLALGID